MNLTVNQGILHIALQNDLLVKICFNEFMRLMVKSIWSTKNSVKVLGFIASSVFTK